MLLVAVAALAVVAIAMGGAGMRRVHRLRGELAAAYARLELLDSPVVGDSGHRAVGASALRREERHRFVAEEENRYRDLLAQLLADFRDVAGAEEATFWRWNDALDGLEVAECSSGQASPVHFDVDEWTPLVQWSIETGTIQTVGHGDTVTVGAVCVVDPAGTQRGALTLTGREGLSLSRTALKAWMPRMAAQLAAFEDLVSVRLMYGKHMRQSQALLDAVQRLQGDQSGEGLARSLCGTAIDLSGGRGAALIRWYPDGEVGEIHFATSGIGIVTRSDTSNPQSSIRLGADSLVARACRSGAIQVFEDARGLASGEELYGTARMGRDPGAVAIMPLLKGGRVVGALVIEADRPGALTLDEARPLAVLGAIAAGSLELAWSYQEVDLRARTDALTGLYNRMHFGEELQRTLNEADRHNQPLSLALVDIDHFKKVNDTWGHEAGDAVLKHVARILKEGCRNVDLCVRYGGEEIAMLMSQTDSVRAAEVAERLRARIASTVIRHAGAEIAVTASFGVATYPETVQVRDQLFPAADKALYLAKHDGRNLVRSRPASKGRTAI